MPVALGRLRPFPRLLFPMQIRPHDVPHERQAAAGGREEAQHGEAGIAEDPEGSLDPHQHRRAHGVTFCPRTYSVVSTREVVWELCKRRATVVAYTI